MSLVRHKLKKLTIIDFIKVLFFKILDDKTRAISEKIPVPNVLNAK